MIKVQAATATTSHDEPTIPREHQDLTPSQKLIYTLLDRNGALPRQAIREETGLSGSTITESLDKLQDRDTVICRPDPTDGRRRRYVLAEDLQPPIQYA